MLLHQCFTEIIYVLMANGYLTKKEEEKKKKEEEDPNKEKEEGPVFPESFYNDEILSISLDYIDLLNGRKTAKN